MRNTGGQEMKVGVVAVQKFKPIPQFGDFRSISQDKYSGMPYRAQGKRTRAGGSISQFCDLLLLLLYLVRQRLDLSLKVSHLISIILSFLKTQPKKKKNVRDMSTQNFQPFLECYYDLPWAYSQVLLFQLLEYHQH